ncbi:MAG: hypothetical protein HY958_08790 [Bacteroidia bacterium]|nr:hypothetical protein [Bacteroidia bacterium]
MKNIIVLLVILFCIVFNNTILAQRWKKVRYEFFYGIGASNFLGDLGGGDSKGRPFIADIDFISTRWALNGGIRYRITERFAAKWNLLYGNVAGSDAWSNSKRTYRNLSFKSIILETSVQGEFAIQKEKTGRRYLLANNKKIRLDGVHTYIFAGVGGFYFNPKAKYINGKWYALQPLGTEGQGLPDAKAKYSRVAACFPIGFGFKYGLTRKMSFALEYGYRFTSTDYIDDVSGSYYDPIAMADRGAAAAYFADPREGTQMPGGTEWRGNPKNKDGYMFILFNVTYKLRVTRTGLPRF